MPVSNITMPSPAASAQALQCGTPGQGSGRRRRHTPGSTRSPRPSSRLRVGSGIEVQPSGSLRRRRRSTRSRGMTDVKPATIIDGAIDAEETERVADAYFAAISAHDVEAAVAMWRPGGRENVRGQVDALAPD